MELGNPNGARCVRGKQTGNKKVVAAIKTQGSGARDNLRPILGLILLSTSKSEWGPSILRSSAPFRLIR